MARPRRPVKPATRRGGPALQVLTPRRPAKTPTVAPAEHPSQWARPRVRTILVASGNDGVGKSSLAANLAIALGERGVRVLLLDADFGQANLDLLMGVHPRYDIQHVLAGEKTLEEIVVEGPAGVKLVPAASHAPELARLDDYRRECLLRGLGPLAESIDVMILDTASGVPDRVTEFWHVADDILVVTTPELPAFSGAYGLVKRLAERGVSATPHLLVNMVATAEEAEETSRRVRQVARRFLRLDLDVWGSVPLDPAVPRAGRIQEPVVHAFPQSPAALAYRAIADRVAPSLHPEPPLRVAPSPERLEA